MIHIDWIKKKVAQGDYFLSGHADTERMKDNLSVIQIEEVLLHGVIIENYPLDKRGASCLVAGFTNIGIPLHVVCGKSAESLIVITVYIPTPPKFKNSYERG